MANGKIRFGKQLGGQLALVIPDGVANTEVIFPESGELVNKEYADLKVALADFTGTNVNLADNGYQKLPSGLIIQWGSIVIASNPTTWTFPIAFPNKCVAISGLVWWGDGMNYINLSTSPHSSTTSIQLKNSNPGTACYVMALGY